MSKPALIIAAGLAGTLITGCMAAPCPPCQTTAAPGTYAAPGYATPTTPPPGAGRPTGCPATGAGVFDDNGFTGGYAVALAPGRYDLPQLEALGIPNDTVRSVCVAPGCSVTLYADAGFVGETRQLGGDTADLADFGGSASGIDVRCTP